MREQEGSSWAQVLVPVLSRMGLEANNLALELVPVLSRMGLEASSWVALALVPSRKEQGVSSWEVLAPELSRTALGEMSRRSSWETAKGQGSSGRELEKETSQGNRIRQKKTMALRKRR